MMTDETRPMQSLSYGRNLLSQPSSCRFIRLRSSVPPSPLSLVSCSPYTRHSTRSPTPSAPEEGRRTEDDEPRRRDERRREGTRRETKSDEGDTRRATGNIIIKTTYDISLDFQDSLLPLGFLSLSRVRSSSSPRSGSGTEGEKDERLTDGDRSGEVRGEKGKGVTRRDPMHSALMSFATVSRPFHSLLHRYACYARHSLLPSFVPHARAAASVRRVRWTVGMRLTSPVNHSSLRSSYPYRSEASRR